MMKRLIKLSAMWFAAAMAYGAYLPANADLIVNGGFEFGFAGWTRVDQLGSEGTFHLQTGTTSPVIAEPVPAPPEGSTAAMTDAEGPGSHVLYQDFVLATPLPSAILSFELFVGNRAEEFFTPDTLDFATPALNQQARIDLLLGGTDPFSVNAADVLLTAFHTQPGDPLIFGYSQYSVDVTALLNAHLNTPLRLRFAETDNVFIFQFGVDNVRLGPALAVPEPHAYLLALGALLAAGWARRRSQAKPPPAA